MRANGPWLALIACLGGVLLYGVRNLESRDRAAGDVYPPYSSLRSGPKGSRLLFDALARTAGLTITRNFQQAGRLRVHGATLLVFGVSEAALVHESEAYFKTWERLAQENRVVLAVEPSSGLVNLEKDRANSEMSKLWGLELGTPEKESGTWRRCFGRAEKWDVNIRERDKPVVVERRFARGSLVVAADALPFANSSLAANAEKPGQARFLSRMVGANAHVVFDEAHFGIEDTGSVMGLARKYRLQGLMAGLALLGMLFFWKAGSPFPSGGVEERAASAAVGGDARAAFTGLLRRHVAPERLSKECLAAWRRTAPRDSRFARMEAAERSAGDQDGDAVRAYERIRKELL